MENNEILNYDVAISIGDIPAFAISEARHAGSIAWDIETSGLDWKYDKICTCQVFIPNSRVFLIRVCDSIPYNLKMLLNDEHVCKVFHHAPFDLRFMTYHWSTEVQNVVCTKIASKILAPEMNDHSLKNLLERYLGIYLDKKMQTSNWLCEKLTEEQLIYAVRDVLYLPTLFNELKCSLICCDRWALADASFDYLPTRVKLDVLGSGDVYLYK